MPEQDSWLQRITQKVSSISEIGRIVDHWRKDGLKIVFTNGCFDLLHYGHIHYLAKAADLGDRLVIGLNSSASVRRIKGDRRPINDEKTRRHMLAALEFVDAVVEFDTDTPYELIRVVEPQVLVKGGDWKPEQIVGADIVLASGGQVLSLPYIEGFSTTAIENKIIQSVK